MITHLIFIGDIIKDILLTVARICLWLFFCPILFLLQPIYFIWFDNEQYAKPKMVETRHGVLSPCHESVSGWASWTEIYRVFHLLLSRRWERAKEVERCIGSKPDKLDDKSTLLRACGVNERKP